MGVGLPDWFDLDALRATTTTLIVAAIIAVIAVVALVRDVTRKVVVALVIAAIGLGIFYYRTTLDDCEKTCDCKFVFDYVDINGCPERE